MHALMCVMVLIVPYRFFVIPVRTSAGAEEELNSFPEPSRAECGPGGWMKVRSRSGASASITLRRGKTGGQRRMASERGRVDDREVLILMDWPIIDGARQASHEPTLWQGNSGCQEKGTDTNFPGFAKKPSSPKL